MKRGENLKPYQFKPGQSGNPKGKPKGKSMKEFARQFLLAMSDEEKVKFMNALDPDIVWRMAEGNPAQDVTSAGERINPMPILGGITSKNDENKGTDTGIQSPIQ